VGQGVHGVGRNVLDVFVELAAELLHEVADEERDVLGALAERRDLNGEDVQAVIEVAAEGALGDALRKIHVGGGDDSDVHALRAIAAEPFEFLLLKHAKKFRLKFEGKVADFVEEERAAIGEFEAADFLTDGAGERAALVAEELGFEKTAGNGGAINLTKVRSRRGLRLWMARAKSSLPVPVSRGGGRKCRRERRAPPEPGPASARDSRRRFPQN